MEDRVNKDPVDRFTLVHVAVGGLYGASGLSWPVALALSIGYELAEKTFKNQFPEIFPSASFDTPVNKVIDVAANMIGWGLVVTAQRRLRESD